MRKTGATMFVVNNMWSNKPCYPLIDFVILNFYSFIDKFTLRETYVSF